MNARDAAAMSELLAPSCVLEGLAYSETLRGKRETGRFYRELLRRLPMGLRVEVDDVGAAGAGPAAIGVTWHLSLDGYAVPYGRGISFYRVNTKGKISYLRESPEHVAKVPLSSLPILNLAAPLMRALAPLAPGLMPRTPIASSGSKLFDGPDADPEDLTPAGLEARLESAAREVDLIRSRITELRGQRSRVAEVGRRLEGRLQQFARRLQDDQATAGSGNGAAGAAPGAATAAATLAAVAEQPAAAFAVEAAPPPLPAPVPEATAASSPGAKATPLPSAPPAATEARSAPAVAEAQAAVPAPPLAEAADGPSPAAMAITAPPEQQQPPSPASAPEPEPERALLDISGVWVKDPDLSDTAGYSRALDLMQLGGLQKAAALQLFEGLEIEQDGGRLAVRFLTVVPFFKVTETFSLEGPSTMARRDLKAGTQAAEARAEPDKVVIDISWGTPNPGAVRETYTCPEPGVLHLLSEVSIGKERQATLQVYRRQDNWTPKNKWPGPLG